MAHSVVRLVAARRISNLLTYNKNDIWKRYFNIAIPHTNSDYGRDSAVPGDEYTYTLNYDIPGILDLRPDANLRRLCSGKIRGAYGERDEDRKGNNGHGEVADPAEGSGKTISGSDVGGVFGEADVAGRR